MNAEADKRRIDTPAPAAGGCPMLSVFIRSFFIQAGWNYERFQNLGFAFAIIPALRKVYPPGERLNAAVLRHLGIFNTQPYMAGFVLGNVAKMEEELAARGGDPAYEKKMTDVKGALASGFAAIGDRIFWGRLKPITTQICIVVWFLCGFYGWLFPTAHGGASYAVIFLGPLAGLAVYGAFSIYMRWHGLHKGYVCGGSSSCGLDAVDWSGLIRLLSVTGFALSLLIVVGAFGLLAADNWAGFNGALALKVSAAAGVMVLQRVTRKFGRSIFFAMGIILAVSMGLSFSGADVGGFLHESVR